MSPFLASQEKTVREKDWSDLSVNPFLLNLYQPWSMKAVTPGRILCTHHAQVSTHTAGSHSNMAS